MEDVQFLGDKEKLRNLQSWVVPPSPTQLDLYIQQYYICTYNNIIYVHTTTLYLYITKSDKIILILILQLQYILVSSDAKNQRPRTMLSYV